MPRRKVPTQTPSNPVVPAPLPGSYLTYHILTQLCIIISNSVAAMKAGYIMFN